MLSLEPAEAGGREDGGELFVPLRHPGGQGGEHIREQPGVGGLRGVDKGRPDVEDAGE